MYIKIVCAFFLKSVNHILFSFPIISHSPCHLSTVQYPGQRKLVLARNIAVFKDVDNSREAGKISSCQLDFPG